MIPAENIHIGALCLYWHIQYIRSWNHCKALWCSLYRFFSGGIPLRPVLSSLPRLIVYSILSTYTDVIHIDNKVYKCISGIMRQSYKNLKDTLQVNCRIMIGWIMIHWIIDSEHYFHALLSGTGMGDQYNVACTVNTRCHDNSLTSVKNYTWQLVRLPGVMWPWWWTAASTRAW